jgi:uncharacterized protein (DUF1800 family)
MRMNRVLLPFVRYAAILLLTALASHAQARAGDADDDGLPDALEAREGTSWLVKDNDIFNNARLFALQAFRDGLRREGGDSEIVAWAGAVGSGAISRENALAAFIRSGEFDYRIAAIIRIYFGAYRHIPDFTQLQQWIDKRDQGMPIITIAHSLVTSAEFIALNGNTTNAQFIQVIYRNVFERQPDATGYTYWIGKLDSGEYTRGIMLNAFIETAEGRAKSRTRVEVTSLYFVMLNGQPDPSGFTYWLSLSDMGWSMEALLPWFYHTVWYKGRFMPYYALATTPANVDAARFISQATFGATSLTDITRVMVMGYDPWINEQLTTQPASHVQYLREAQARNTQGMGMVYAENSFEALWQQWLFGPDQLRARTSFALSEIFVISDIAPNLDPWAMSSYMDMLNRNAFGNFRKLLEDVTLHPAMGYYLNMLGNEKEDLAKGRNPNENYAREVLQLFTVGLVKLNIDGTPLLGTDGKSQPTFDQETIEGFARVFTGWGYAANNNLDNSTWTKQKKNWLDPMIAWQGRHSSAAKKLLDGTSLPGGQTAERDLKDALDNIFYHPNVGPFICKQLIQRFITSNPSRGQIQRCATIFNNNGFGERGNLAYTVRYVLMDPEARDPSLATGNGAGKQREPVIRFANFMRAFNARSLSGRNGIHYLDSPDDSLGQSPLLAPSVFNFFSPNYRPPGPVAQAGLLAPEFQLTTETSVVGALNFFRNLVNRGSYGDDAQTKLTLDYSVLNTVAVDYNMLVDYVNMLLFAGAMRAETRTTMVNAVMAVPNTKVSDRVKLVLTLAQMAPEYVIQK